MTFDMWHMTCDRWREVKIHTVLEWRCFEDLEKKDDSVFELIIWWMNYKGFCRTAPATLGLVNKKIQIYYSTGVWPTLQILLQNWGHWLQMILGLNHYLKKCLDVQPLIILRLVFCLGPTKLYKNCLVLNFFSFLSMLICNYIFFSFCIANFPILQFSSKCYRGCIRL